MPTHAKNRRAARENRKINALTFNDYQKEMEMIDFMARQKATNDLPALHKQLQALSKVDGPMTNDAGQMRVSHANGSYYFIDKDDKEALKHARSAGYQRGGLAAKGSDFKNNVATNVGGNTWVKPQQSFQEFQANSIDDDMAQEVVPPNQGVPIHPVTGLRIEKGDNWNSYTDAPSGTTYNNSNFNWNNKGFKTPTGNVDGLSQAQIDGLYGRPSSPEPAPQQDIVSWFKENWGK